MLPAPLLPVQPQTSDIFVAMEGGTYLHPYPHVSPPLGLPVLDQGWPNSWQVDLPAYTQNPQDYGEATSPYELPQDMQAYQVFLSLVLLTQCIRRRSLAPPRYEDSSHLHGHSDDLI